MNLDDEIQAFETLSHTTYTMAEKWENEQFVREQLVHHLDEVKELIAAGDEHAINECIDLALIAIRYSDLRSAGRETFATKVVSRVKKFWDNRNR